MDTNRIYIPIQAVWFPSKSIYNLLWEILNHRYMNKEFISSLNQRVRSEEIREDHIGDLLKAWGISKSDVNPQMPWEKERSGNKTYSVTGTSLVVQWLSLCAFNAGHADLIPGQGMKVPTCLRGAKNSVTNSNTL